MLSKVVLACVVASGAALVAPATKSAPKTLVKAFDYSSIPGGKGGLGTDYNFDPLQLAQKYPDSVPWFREAELKHGRMAMLAVVGMIVPAFVRVPGAQFEGTYFGWECHDRLVASGAMGQILLFVSLFEIIASIPATKLTMEGKRAPGDYAFGETFKPSDPEKYANTQLKELKNGRLAMLAISGIFTQAALTGNGFPFLY